MKPLKRYALFAGEYYYPSGGWHDFCDSFDDVDAALKHLRENVTFKTWWHVVDLQTGEQVVRSEP